MPHAYHNNDKGLIEKGMFWINTILADIYHLIFINFHQKCDESIAKHCHFINVIYVRSYCCIYKRV